MKRTAFGITRTGVPAERLTLDNGQLEISLLTYGASLQSVSVPARDGGRLDVLLGFDTLEDYELQDKYMGATVGRYANRIADGQFSLDGRTYQLARNNGENHLHGGVAAFHTKVWTVEAAEDASVCLRYESPDGEEGYPGDLTAWVTYRLEGTSLRVDYRAETTKPTICSLTTHPYWNLNGHGSGSALRHRLTLCADRYTPVRPGSIPTGELAPVAGTPMDFRTAMEVGARLEEPFEQLALCGGYDHNWALNGAMGTLHPAARLEGDASGIVLEVETTLPGIQCYTANYVGGCPVGKGGAVYQSRDAVALEAQLFPDSPHHPSFPSCVLRPGEVWAHSTVYRFSS